MAIDVLSAPVMSAESERVWLMAKKTISVDRRNLSSDMLEQSELQKSWIYHCLVEEDFGSDSQAGNEEERRKGRKRQYGGACSCFATVSLPMAAT